MGKSPYIYKKGVAALAPKTNQKWLERTCEGAYIFATHPPS